MILRGIVAGAVLLVLGAALFFVPISGQGVTSFSDQSSSSEVAGNNAPATFWEPSITPAAISFSVSWAYSIPVNVSVYSCGTDTSCVAGSAYETPAQLVAQGASAIGTLTFNGIAGNGYEVYASSIISVNIAYNGPLFGGLLGLFFMVIGAIALVAGAAVPAGGLRPPSDVKDSVLRQPAEMLRWYWTGNWDGSPGGLLLSNQRLILLDRKDFVGGSSFSTREGIGLKELQAVEPSAASDGRGQLVLKTAAAAPRTFTIEGKFTPRRAARAIQRASAMGAVGTAGARKREMPAGAALTEAPAAAGASAPSFPSPSGSSQVIYKEREVVREVVKIPCRFCGQLNDQLSPKCSGCGASTGRT
ncbi:MAG TPA: hypothetical protein VK455_02580 [Thermoplasmata archaeon]|nr:hypothetical protein [Thermoplasmata archaeon]